MVLATAGMAVASEASRERDNGESFISTAFKFSILIIALLGLIVLVIGLYVFNNWAGILSIPADIVGWVGSKIGGFWGALTGIIPAVGSFLLPSKRSISGTTLRGVNPQDIV